MLEPQTVLQGRYQINHQLGQGGMGAVYFATDQRFGSIVAVKETFFNDVNLRKAFEREAKLLNSLRHPALPRVSDHFIEGDGQFLVMEFIEGEDLGAMLEERGAFPVEQVLHWADQILDALDYLHTQEPRVIHRDIKPQNLKLTPKGQVILLDFGLAKGSPSHLTNRATNTGSIFGYSRHYAPLEQIQGSGTDPRSDIYALAATLYHLMTGVIPPDALSRATAIINGEQDPLIPANEVHAQVNSAIGQVLFKAMSQTSANRQASASILRGELREAATEGLTNEKSTKPFAHVQTILDQDTKIMDGVNTLNLETENPVSESFDALKTVPMTNTGDVQKESFSSNETVAMYPQVVSNPSPSFNAASTQIDSEVTKIATHIPTKSSWGKSRYLAFAAAVVLLLVGSGLAYRYAFKTTETNTSGQEIQNVTVDAPNTNAQIETTNQDASKDTTSINNSSQKTEQRKQQTSSTNKTKDENGNTATPPQPPPAQPNQTTNNDGVHDPNAPVQQRGKYPDGLTDAERQRIEAARQKQIEEKQREIIRRRKEQLRRKRPPQLF